ncbi:lysylphosphatidylglycerol synthase domain-containing protein [Tanticharoenia sakaeratensis]|uniref:lysylphosphatidylglycerol synthase domain-containing protein n=1 Tax=Tanticharoenia sakaeratensis TaxID=444053 RepID=UPI000AC3F0B4|nr:lysylphosphatidylglycerol synthase domain-containing protein [Tanticharoenia sakaeratensis]
MSVAPEPQADDPIVPCAGSAGAPHRWRRLLHRLPAALGLVLMIAAIVVIVRELHTLSFHDIRAALHAMPGRAVNVGIACTVLSYTILSFYDWLACRQVGADVSYRRAAFAAFCSYVLSHNLGCSAISGAAVRFRLYRNWGVGSAAIAQIIAFCSTTYLLGTLALIGGVLLAEPGHLPLISTHVPEIVPIVIGIGMWAVIAAYVVMSLRPRVLRIRHHEIDLPGIGTALAQVAVSSADMAATALIAYVLLPHGVPISFGAFLAIYMMSYTAGLLASVPGGLGVFDGAMMLALGHYMSASAILSTILVFRVLYYIVPLVLAGLMFAGHEMFLRGDAALGRKRAQAARRRGEPAPVLAPRPSHVIRESEADFSVAVATGVVAASGILLVVYAMLPSAYAPTGFGGWWLHEVTDCLLSVTGVTLVGLAIGLSQRVLLAWKATIGCLLWAIALVLLRHAPIGVPGSLALVIVLIAPFSSCYYRPARLMSEPWSPTLMTPVMLWIASLVSIAIFASERHLGVSWWRELLHGAREADVRWVLGLSVLLGLIAIGQMMRVGRIPVLPWDRSSEERYRELDHALAELGPRRPNGVLFGDAGRAAIPFLRTERFIIGLGDPAGQARFCTAAIWRLRDLALHEGRHLVFIRIGQALQGVYCDLGLSVCQNAPAGAGTLCCLPQDEPAVRAVLIGDQRRFARRARNTAAIVRRQGASAP